MMLICIKKHLSKIWSSIHGGKWPVSIKYQNLRSFQEGLILLCRVSLKRESIKCALLKASPSFDNSQKIFSALAPFYRKFPGYFRILTFM